MKKIKKLSVVIVALAVCMLFGSVVWAESGTAGTNVFAPSLDKTALHVSDQEQTVTVTIKAATPVTLLGATGTVYVSDASLKYDSVCFNETESEYDENGNTFLWYDAEADGVAVQNLVSVTVTIPADYVGTVMFGLSELQYAASLNAANGTVDEVVASNLIETVVVSGHSHKDYGKDDTNHWSVCACGKTIGEAVAHDFTSGDCVCGQPKPVTNVTVTYKGAALASAYSVNGQTVTVTHTAACKLGYWDAASGKYVALPATNVTGNTYFFSVPDGVSEVLLVVKGDVNGNGSVNVLDKNTLGKSILPKANANYQALAEAWQIFAADVNGNGSVNVLDKNTLGKSILPKANANYQALTW